MENKDLTDEKNGFPWCQGCQITPQCWKNGSSSETLSCKLCHDSEGLANGAQKGDQIVLNPGERPSQVMMLGGCTPVAAVQASQVPHVVLHHSNKQVWPHKHFLPPAKEAPHQVKTKILKPKKPRKWKDMKEKRSPWRQRKQRPTLLWTLPPLATSAPGHFGGVDCLFCCVFSTTGAVWQTGWLHVMLTRVRMKKGLFCHKELPRGPSKVCVVPESLRKMLRHFGEHALPCVVGS